MYLSLVSHFKGALIKNLNIQRSIGDISFNPVKENSLLVTHILVIESQ